MTDPAAAGLSFTAAFTRALHGQPCTVLGLDEEPTPLPTDRWSGPVDAADRALLDLCHGPTLDVGCGPGRLTEELGARGQIVLGIDVVAEAVVRTSRRGAAALRRDVFEAVPAEGRWATALLADGNIGIGGEPVALLDRLRAVVAPGGRVVAEVAEPGVAGRSVWAALQCADGRSRPFRWAVVGVDDLAALARRALLEVEAVHRAGSRWCTVLRVPA